MILKLIYINISTKINKKVNFLLKKSLPLTQNAYLYIIKILFSVFNLIDQKYYIMNQVIYPNFKIAFDLVRFTNCEKNIDDYLHIKKNYNILAKI